MTRRKPLSTEAVALGAAIKERRVALGMEQQALAESTGIDPGEMSRIERGIREPSVAQLRAIGRALKTTPGQLLSGDCPRGHRPSRPRTAARVVGARRVV